MKQDLVVKLWNQAMADDVFIGDGILSFANLIERELLQDQEPVACRIYNECGDVQLLCIDATRYRWLKEKRPVLLATGFFGNGCSEGVAEVDAAIDKAMTPNAS